MSSPSDTSPSIVDTRRLLETVRVLLLLDREVLAEVVVLALRDGDYVTCTVETVPEARTAPETWQPHLAIVDMAAGGVSYLERARTVTVAAGLARLPVIALPRRGKLDVLLSVPLSPEALLARTRAVLRRTYGPLPRTSGVRRRGGARGGSEESDPGT